MVVFSSIAHILLKEGESGKKYFMRKLNDNTKDSGRQMAKETQEEK
jgi:hypothetical protein